MHAVSADQDQGSAGAKLGLSNKCSSPLLIIWHQQIKNLELQLSHVTADTSSASQVN